MKKLATLLIALASLLLSYNCAKDSNEKVEEEIKHTAIKIDKIINYTIERSINLDYRAWARLELTEEQNPKARLTFFGTLEPYFTDGLQVKGRGVKTELAEKGLIMFDLNFKGLTLPTSGCDENLSYRLVLLEGGTIDVTRGALVVFCGEPAPKNELYVYRVFFKEQ